MIDDYEVIFAGVSSADLCIYAVNRPNIPAAERDIETLEVRGRWSIPYRNGTNTRNRDIESK